jgi:Flp pilus assembly protein TadD
MNPSADDPIPELLRRVQDASTQEAVPLLLQAADAHPGDPRPLLLLAAEFAQAREYDRAEAAYTGALQRAPAFAIARFQLGLLQFTNGRAAAALATWGPLQSLAESDPLRLFARGLECLARDDLAQARVLLQQGIAANATNPPLNRDMEMLLLQMATQQQGSAAAAEAESPAPADSHFLVSSYKKLS